MAILLETDSGTNADITSELSIGSYTASGAKMVLAQIRLSSLNGAAATITAKLQQTSAADALIGTRDALATPKDAAANTVWSGRALGPIYLADGEKAICKVASTNASDTAAAWSVEWLDAAAVSTTDVVTAILAGVVDGTITLQNALKYLLAERFNSDSAVNATLVRTLQDAAGDPLATQTFEDDGTNTTRTTAIL